MDEQKKSGIPLAVAYTRTDDALRPFLRAATSKEKERLFDRLDSEFLSPLAKAVLSQELRRGYAASSDELFAQNDAFRDLYLQIRARLAKRLNILHQRFAEADVTGFFTGETIGALSAYVVTAARHACVDYLRQKYPGRHALDVALRAVLESSDALGIWKVTQDTDILEWRCGKRAWQENGRDPLTLRANPTLQRRLKSGLNGLERGEALRVVFEIAPGPLRYTELLDFLADHWNVEATYRMADLERVPFHVAKPYQSGLQPEAAAVSYGTLQVIWGQMAVLNMEQAATLLLKMPPMGEGNGLTELVRLGIATWTQIAQKAGIPEEELQALSATLPLEDEEIATRLHVAPDEVRRIRQDARRKLARHRGRE